MEDDRELDRQVAEQVFKHEVIIDRVEHGGDGAPKWIDVDGVWHDLPHYSERIADAWLVVEKLREAGWLVRVQEMPDGWPWLANRIDEPEIPVRKRCVCLLDWFGHNWQERADWRRHSDPHPVCPGDTSSEAICWAALATCGEEA